MPIILLVGEVALFHRISPKVPLGSGLVTGSIIRRARVVERAMHTFPLWGPVARKR